MKKISLLGSTGSVGRAALGIIAANPDKFGVEALAAGSNLALLEKQIRRFRPKLVSVFEKQKAEKIARKFPKIDVVHGIRGLTDAAGLKSADTVLTAVVGSIGLLPTLTAARAGKRIAVANKEALVIGGELVMREASAGGAEIIPVDSEHSAIFQSLLGHDRHSVKNLILTASGGPFRKLTKKQLEKVSVRQALDHPNWKMGRKITIDSATMMNKGMEIIEAKWLFAVAPESILVLVHPQSIIHSMVEYRDGSFIAQLGVPDMKIPIAYALSYPARIETAAKKLDLAAIGKLEFEQPDTKRFPALNLAYWALKLGGVAPAVLNAANEVAVDAFLSNRLRFDRIPVVIRKVLDKLHYGQPVTVESILQADRIARIAAASEIEKLYGR